MTVLTGFDKMYCVELDVTRRNPYCPKPKPSKFAYCRFTWNLTVSSFAQPREYSILPIALRTSVFK
ncbi:hypothetical protein L917_11637 [Phytophthora nicotianae]|uniref:Uncharacterized protein n=1 Tax=Phytophthora nicotianae TaxID=4792 RepID=W2GKR3_PHYNI|nr:hypothetical protein L915_11854 [Phytophthora nicotianae]ETL36213.1 hypothetical protein L916_11782 [Phytophthora nicotianae]ETL89438.1 hypothetical protein L917_11637 [Phytophthora nicotianae]ETM42715.1 hypothetical protein L914_11686 [Phytophthora nicotianae]